MKTSERQFKVLNGVSYYYAPVHLLFICTGGRTPYEVFFGRKPQTVVGNIETADEEVPMLLNMECEVCN